MSKLDWKKHEPMIKAIVDLLHPLVEVAIHDLNTGTIVALYHNISQRKVGDPSPLHELGIETTDFPDYFPPYYKKNWDHRPLKCTSITLRNEKGKAIGLICINMDTSLFLDIQRMTEAFLKVEEGAENPIEQFGAGCEEQTKTLVEAYLKENHLSLSHLSREQKKDLIIHLYHKGILNYKSAAHFLSKYLKISRASIYNYIKTAI